jgi:hypothetical protein
MILPSWFKTICKGDEIMSTSLLYHNFGVTGLRRHDVISGIAIHGIRPVQSTDED